MIGFPKTETPLEENIQTGIDVMTSIGGQAKAAQQLTKPITGLLQRQGAAKNVSLMLGDDVGQQIAAGVPAAMVADQVATMATDNGVDPFETGALALSAGLLAGLTGAKSYRGVTRDKIPLFTPEMARNQARSSYTKVSEAGVDINKPDAYGYTPLMMAIISGNNDKYVDAMIKEGADVNSVNNSGASILMVMSGTMDNEKIMENVIKND
jgi:hypothetical protein